MKKKRNSHRFLYFILTVVLLSAAGGFFLHWYLAPLPETMVPDVIGLNENDAVARLERMGLTVKIDSRDSASTIVTSQRPEPGKIVKVGRVVFIVFGKSDAEFTLPPSVVVTPGLTPEAATPEVQIELVPQEEEQ